jgi:hypothetical protein
LIVTATKQVKQAQEQVQDIEIETDGQQNCSRQRVLGEFDPLHVVDDKATEEYHAHQSDDERQRACSEKEAKDAGDDHR